MKMQWVKVNCGAGGRNLGQFHGEPDYDTAQLRVGDYYKSSVDGNTYEWRMASDDKPHFDFSRRPNSGKNDWYERGDRPPVGAICEAKINHGHWRWEHVEILMHSKKSEKECGTYCEKLGILAWSDEFRTIQTEDRKKAIDEMLKISYTPEVISNRTIMGALYDAGFRKEGK